MVWKGPSAKMNSKKGANQVMPPKERKIICANFQANLRKQGARILKAVDSFERIYSLSESLSPMRSQTVLALSAVDMITKKIKK